MGNKRVTGPQATSGPVVRDLTELRPMVLVEIFLIGAGILCTLNKVIPSNDTPSG